MSEYKVMFCHECGAKLIDGARFCQNCGTPLYGSDKKDEKKSSISDDNLLKGFAGLGVNSQNYIPPATGGMMCPLPTAEEKDADKKLIDDNEKKSDNKPSVQSEKLKLLVDCCSKVLSTASGDGHNETVLYLNEKTGEYQIHTYSQEVGVLNEIHHAYVTDEKTIEEVMKKIEETGLESYENKSGAPLSGGEYVCKFMRGDKAVRITTSSLPYEKHGDLHMIHSFLNSFINKENEISV